jgi:hypothetical protein
VEVGAREPTLECRMRKEQEGTLKCHYLYAQHDLCSACLGNDIFNDRDELGRGVQMLAGAKQILIGVLMIGYVWRTLQMFSPE